MFVVIATLVIAAGLGQVEPLEALEPLEPLESLEPPAETILPVSPPEPAVPILAPNFLPGTVLYVNASSLALRTGPRLDAALIQYIPKDTRIIALADVIDPVPLEVGNKKGLWIYIQHDQHKGYVFDAYLVQAPPSLDEQLDWLCYPGKRVGPITNKTTYEDMVLIFGEVNISDTQIPMGNGSFEKGTAIFAGDAARQIIVQWAIPRVKPKAVVVSGTQWRTISKIGPGTRIRSIIQANGGPISFAGFEWQYAGFITSWRGGKLEADHELSNSIMAYLAPKEPYLPVDYKALTGDQEFSSDLPEADRLNLHISTMTIMLNE